MARGLHVEKQYSRIERVVFQHNLQIIDDAPKLFNYVRTNSVCQGTGTEINI